MSGFVKRLFAKPSQAEQMKTGAKPTEDTLRRVLFIGFGRVPGFHAFNWNDWQWLNAADFDVAFVNCGSLFSLLSDWKEQYQINEDTFDEGRIDRLSDNLRRLSGQILEMIITDRSVFALGIQDAPFRFGTSQGSFMTGYNSVSLYDWCPLPVTTVDEGGDVVRDVDPRFVSYRSHVKKWLFYYDIGPRRVDYLEKRAGLKPDKLLALTTIPLFENLSRKLLGVELRLQVFVGMEVDPSGDLVRLRNPKPTDRTSGPVYLLHYPVGGDLMAATRCLLREFCQTDIVVTEEPIWLAAVLPPKGNELNDAVRVLSTQIEELEQQRSRLIDQKAKLEKWRYLLYETGDVLEDVVFQALELFGLRNARFGPKGDHDIIGELDGELMMFEVKGLTKAVGRKEIFDLDRHMQEYRVHNPGKEIARGVLIANAYREHAPASRDSSGRQIFAGDAVKHADLLTFALLDTRVVYQVVTDVLEQDDPEIGLQFLRHVRRSQGVVNH